MRLAKYFFQDKTGNYVVGQPPNIPIYIIIISFLISRLVNIQQVKDFSDFIFYAAIFLWSYLEILYGESLFRKVLGVVVMITLLISRFI